MKTGLLLHNTNTHVKGNGFTKPFSYPERRWLDKVEMINSLYESACLQGPLKQAFSCPEFARTKMDKNEPPLVQDLEEWIVHWAAVHRDVYGSVMTHPTTLSRKQTEIDQLAENGG